LYEKGQIGKKADLSSLVDLKEFNNQNKMINLQRASEKGEIEYVKRLYGIVRLCFFTKVCVLQKEGNICNTVIGKVKIQFLLPRHSSPVY
jgi:hypothetical protein